MCHKNYEQTFHNHCRNGDYTVRHVPDDGHLKHKFLLQHRRGQFYGLRARAVYRVCQISPEALPV